MIEEPQGAFMYRSSTILDLSDFGFFHGLLLTVFGVPEQFPWLPNPKLCLCVGRQDSQFAPILARLLDYYSVLGS